MALVSFPLSIELLNLISILAETENLRALPIYSNFKSRKIIFGYMLFRYMPVAQTITKSFFFFLIFGLAKSDGLHRMSLERTNADQGHWSLLH